MNRIVPVPSVARSAHAVFTTEPLGPRSELEVPPVALLRRFGASDAAIASLEARPHAQGFLVEAPLSDAAERLESTRREALALAEENDGIVVDLLTPRIVQHAAHETDRTVASQWIAIDIVDDVLSTRGLEAFGLPELTTSGISRDTMVPFIAVVTGLAHRLITEWPANDPVGPAAVTLRDVARGYADAEADTAPVDPAIDLLIAYSHDTLILTVLDDPAALFADR